jgi:pimeloyl-ACP methyl ester carboxylesterase
MADVDASIARLRNQGATAIVVAGHSLGGFGALYYGATHTGLVGIVALAPAPGPGIARRPEIVASLQRAQSLIGEGQGDVFQNFTDINTNARGTGPIEVKATANIFVSFFDMSRGANMVTNASQLKAPVLWVSGTRDPSQISRTAGFDQTAPNPLNRYEQIDSAHMETPDKAADIAVDWLKALPSK